MIAVALLVTAPPGLGGDPRPRQALPKGQPRTEEFQHRVNKAIDAGVGWLRKQQEPDGGFRKGLAKWGHGPTALAVLTLRACGAPFDDSAGSRGFDNLRHAYPSGQEFFGGGNNYGVALTLLALEAHWEPGSDGTRTIPEPERAWIRWLVRHLVNAQAQGGGFGYGDSFQVAGRSFDQWPEGYWDNSNSQYALLGLGAARLLGEGPPSKVWLAALRHWLGTQAKDGPRVARYENAGVEDDEYGGVTLRKVGSDRARGWYYREDHTVTVGSMTGGGVSSLALCRDALKGDPVFTQNLDVAVLNGLRDGIAWLGNNFSVEGNPIEGQGRGGAKFPLFQYYYLYGLERAGVLADTAWMCKHDWYLEGAEYLLRAQSVDGSWHEALGAKVEPVWAGVTAMPQVETCFALLFLKRASMRLRTPTDARVRTTTPEGIDPDRGPLLEEAAFQELFTAVFRQYVAAEPKCRETKATEFVRMGMRAVPSLMMRLEDGALEVRIAALDALRRTTGQTCGFNPAGAESERMDAVCSWEAWWISHRSRLVADVKSGGFIER